MSNPDTVPDYRLFQHIDSMLANTGRTFDKLMKNNLVADPILRESFFRFYEDDVEKAKKVVAETKEDYYKLIGVERNAKPEQINKAILDKTSKHNRDSSMLSKLEEARYFLLNPELKAVYDKHHPRPLPIPPPFEGAMKTFNTKSLDLPDTILEKIKKASEFDPSKGPTPGKKPKM